MGIEIQAYENLLDRIAKGKMERWDLAKMKQSHPTFLEVIYEAMHQADLEYKKLVSEMRVVQKEYFACNNAATKERLKKRAIELEQKVDRYRISLDPKPQIIQPNLFGQ